MNENKEKVLSDTEVIKKLMESAKSQDLTNDESIVSGMTEQDMSDFYDLCEKITLLEAVVSHIADSESAQENPNLTLSTVHLVTEIKEKMWGLYYYLEDNSFDDPIEIK